MKPTDLPAFVQLVKFPDAGVPRAGVTRVGLVANTASPVPVSSVKAERRLALDGVPKNVTTLVPRLVTPVPPLATATVVPFQTPVVTVPIVARLAAEVIEA